MGTKERGLPGLRLQIQYLPSAPGFDCRVVAGYRKEEERFPAPGNDPALTTHDLWSGKDAVWPEAAVGK